MFYGTAFNYSNSRRLSKYSSLVRVVTNVRQTIRLRQHEIQQNEFTIGIFLCSGVCQANKRWMVKCIRHHKQPAYRIHVCVCVWSEWQNKMLPRIHPLYTNNSRARLNCHWVNLPILLSQFLEGDRFMLWQVFSLLRS